MRIRKCAKQMKLFYKNSRFNRETMDMEFPYKVQNMVRKCKYLERTTRKYYRNKARKCKPGSMMYNYYVHKSCDMFLFRDIMEMWGCKLED